MRLNKLHPTGAPLLNPQSLEIGGIVYGSGTEQVADSPIYPFAKAYHLSVLAAASGLATDGRPLVEFLARPSLGGHAWFEAVAGSRWLLHGLLHGCYTRQQAGRIQSAISYLQLAPGQRFEL